MRSVALSLLTTILMSASFPALSQYVIGGIRYTCPVGSNWNDPRCIREALSDESMKPYEQQAPVWETRWGSIATDASSGSLGAAIGMNSKRSAEKEAMSNCRENGGNFCEIDLSYRNQCAVMILGSTIYNTQGAETVEIATKIGLEKCTVSDTNCRVYYADCSLPERVR